MKCQQVLFTIHLIILKCPDIINAIFKLRQNTYNLKNFHVFESPNPKAAKFGFDSIAYWVVSFVKMFLKKLEMQSHFLSSKRQERRSLWLRIRVTVVRNTSTTFIVLYLVFVYLIKYTLVPYAHQICRIFLTLYATLH